MRLKLLNTHFLPIAFVTILALTIRLYSLSSLMPFIGDQAWFYTSAQEAIRSGHIPFVGITASRTWLHQGAFWTYMLIPILKISSHPAAPAYITALLGTITTLFLYAVLKAISHKKAALIGALLYASSPLVIISDRMPYHTSLTPLLTLGVLYSLWKIIDGNSQYWIVLTAFLAIMQNINLAGFSTIYVIALFFILGRIFKHAWTTSIPKKIFVHSVLVWTIIMMPFLRYDMTHGFHQTVIFYGWMILEPFRALLFPTHATFLPIMIFLAQTIQRLIFLPSLFVSIGLFLSALALAIRHIYIKRTSYKDPITYVTLWTMSMFGIVIAGKTSSDAYVYTLFPLVIMLCAQIAASIKIRKALIGALSIAVINVILLVQSQYLMGIPGGYGAPLHARIALVQDVITDAHGEPYAIHVAGPGAQFSSTGMYFDYIAGWLGQAPVTYNPKRIYEIYEKDGKLCMKRIPLFQ